MEYHFRQLINTFIAKNPDKDVFKIKRGFGLTIDEWDELLNKQVVLKSPEYRYIGLYFIDNFLVWIDVNVEVCVKNTKEVFKKLADKLNEYIDNIVKWHISSDHSHYCEVKEDVQNLNKLLDNCSCDFAEELRDMLPKEEFFV